MKKSYEIITPLRRDGVRVETGTVDLEAEEGDALVAIGALRPGEQAPAPDAGAAAKTKVLEEQSGDELRATAKAEKVPRHGLIKDEARLRVAIQRHRASKAGS